ncbi:syntaxin of plants 51, partial [Prunus dulcis]
SAPDRDKGFGYSNNNKDGWTAQRLYNECEVHVGVGQRLPCVGCAVRRRRGRGRGRLHSMASSSDSWMKEYNEATKLADDINGMISERSTLPASGPDAQRYVSAIRRKITILGTRLDSLQSLLSKLPGKQPISEKELNRRKDMIGTLRSKVQQMSTTLTSHSANRDSLLGPEINKADAMGRTVGLDNYGLVEQDEGLEKLEETVVSTKHIALAVNEELDLHARLIDDLDEHVEVTDSRLRRVQKNLAVLNKRTKGGCSCMCMLLCVVGIVVLLAVIFLLIKYL